MTNNKVTVVIPVKNGQKTLEKCLKALLLQTYKNYEIILVDNNSKDKTKNIILNFQKTYSNIKYIFEKRPGIGQARNTGEKLAKGEIILMTDSDCYVPQNWIEKIILPISNNKAIAVQGAFQKPENKNYWANNFYLERDRIMNQHTKNHLISVL